MTRIRSIVPWLFSVLLLVFLFTTTEDWMDSNLRRRDDEFGIPRSNRDFYAIQDEASNLNARLRTAILSDSIKPVIPTKPGIFAASLAGDREGLDRLVNKAKREVNADALSAVGIIAVPENFGKVVDRSFSTGRNSVFTGVKNGVPYCAVAVTVYRPFPTQKDRWYISGEDRDNLLGPCALYGRYGAPGRTVNQWLEEGQFHRTTYEWHNAYDRSDRNPVSRRIGPFGATVFFDMSTAARACAAGRKEVCTTAMTDKAENEDRFYTLAFWGKGVLPSQSYTMRVLEADFGHERFARFWNSTDNIETAFSNAFGVSIGDWVYSQTKPYRHLVEATPRMSITTLLLTLLTIAALTGITLMTAMRRAV